MKRSSTRRLAFLTTLFVAAGIVVLSLSHASLAAGGAACGEAHGCCDAPCQGGDPCGEACVATVENQTVEKKCWDVECKKVCVPQVVCPWSEGGSGLTCFDWLWSKKKDCGCGAGCCNSCECGPEPRCGKVICVRDLKAVTYECEERVCKWEIRRLPACGDACCADPVACGEGPEEGEDDASPSIQQPAVE